MPNFFIFKNKDMSLPHSIGAEQPTSRISFFKILLQIFVCLEKLILEDFWKASEMMWSQVW